MVAQQSAPAHLNIAFDLGLDGSLASQLNTATLHAEMDEDFDELLQILGVPGQPSLQFSTIHQTAGGPARVLCLSVGGQLASFPSTLLTRVYHYVAGEAPEEAFTRRGLLSTLACLSAVQLGEFVRLACVEIIKQSPGVLLTPDTAAAYRSALRDYWGGFDLPDARWLQDVLLPVLNLRISIADRAMVSQRLQEGLTKAWSPAALTEELIAALRPKVVEIQLPHEYLKQLTLSASESDRGNFVLMRDGLFYMLGVRFPDFAFVPVADLLPDSFRFKINHLTTLPTRGLRIDECLVNDTPDRLGLLCIEGRAALNPANMNLCAIMPAKDADMAKEAGLTSWNQLGYLILTMSAELRACAPCFLDRAEVEAQLEKLELAFPKLVEAAREHLSSEVLAQTLRQLLSEEISIRNLPRILQAMIDLDHDGSPYAVFDPQAGVSRGPERIWFEDPINLASLARACQNRYVSHKYQQSDNTLVVYLLDQEIEALLANHQLRPTHAYLAQIESADKERIMNAVRAELEPLPATARCPVVLTTSSVRPILRELIAPEFPKVAVLCYHELAADMKIQPIARISLS